MAGQQSPRRTSLNWDESDTDEDKEEIDKVKAKLGEKLQAKEDCQPPVKWRKRDQFGRLIVKSRSSSKLHAKRQKKTGQSQLPNISTEHVADSTEGLTVGEEVEAVHSYLSRVAKTTKYMSKARRTDMITIHACGWNLRKKQNLHRYLSQRCVKTKKRTDEMDKDIQNLQTKLQTTEEGMKQWVKEVEE
ncbi:Linoleate 9S-lipoxygenase B [Dissostichus eleginoides]|uniref:Linoleate 9S-lipoxygenase B n=1 Tax=Dissostichus eleginoides TaxID=100907 RepID=A0AAD9B713_DISEL|nr:Linoleate 9S-lipoxygenase B [Dissostichus eleginoides]